MKIDVTQNLLGLDREPMFITFQACPMCGRGVEEKGVWTLRRACEDALLPDYQDERQGSGVSEAEKFLRYRLAARIHDEDEPNLSAKDIVLLLKVLAKMFPPRIYGPARLLLDPPEESELGVEGSTGEEPQP